MNKFCMKCGKPLENGAKFCSKCGTEVVPIIVPSSKEGTIETKNPVVSSQKDTTIGIENTSISSSKKRVKNKIWYIVPALLLIVVVGIAVTLLMSREKEDKVNTDENMLAGSNTDDGIYEETQSEIEGLTTEGISEEMIEGETEKETLSNEEWEAMCIEGGFDKYGYKKADYDEIMEAGEPCNGWLHFNIQGNKMAELMKTQLSRKDIKLHIFEKKENILDNYCILDEYGNVHSYYETTDFYPIEDDEDANSFAGSLNIVWDTVTGDLMYVVARGNDANDVKQVIDTALQIVTEDIVADISSFSDDFDEYIQSKSDQNLFEYDKINIDIYYFGDSLDSVYYSYSAYVYLRVD